MLLCWSLLAFGVGMLLLLRSKCQPRRWQALLSDPYYELTKTEKKTLEGRRNYDKWRAMRPGDIVQFRHATDADAQRAPFERHVRARFCFPTFRAALEHFHSIQQLHRLLPNVETVEQGVAVYAKFVSLPTQLRDGVVVLELCTRSRGWC